MRAGQRSHPHSLPCWGVSVPLTVPLDLQGFFLPISMLIAPVSLRLVCYSDPLGLKQLFTNVLAITTIGSGIAPSIGNVTLSSSTSVGFYDLPAPLPIVHWPSWG